MPETTPLIKAALNLRVGTEFDGYVLCHMEQRFTVKNAVEFYNGWDILCLKGVEQYAKYQTYFRFAKLQRRAA